MWEVSKTTALGAGKEAIVAYESMEGKGVLGME